MPFRQSPDRKLLDLQRRTGEPSPAIRREEIWNYPEDYGKASGSFTQSMRMSLWEWMKEKYGSRLHPLTFEYRLHRKKVITVVGKLPYIKHIPDYGHGKKGFVLAINIMSIDGILYRGPGMQHFAWDRIIGKESFLALPSPIKQVEVPVLEEN